MLPCPNLINLSWITELVELIVVVEPFTVKLPVTVISPDTVILSPIVTSDVEWPIVTAIPSVSVAIFNVPVLFVK